jgi:hypothetical protein
VSVALVIQQAKHIPCIVLSSETYLALPHFPTLSHKWHDFWKKAIDYKMCVLIFSTTLGWNIYHSKNSPRDYHKCTYVFMSSTHYSSQILIKRELSWQIVEKFSNIKSHENPPSGSWVFSCGQADMMKLTYASYNFVNAPRNGVTLNRLRFTHVIKRLRMKI